MGQVFVHTFRIFEISLKVQVGSVCVFFSGLFDVLTQVWLRSFPRLQVTCR